MNIELLKKKLAIQGVTIDKLPIANSISGEDSIELFQNGISKHLPIKVLLDSTKSPIYRVDGRNMTLSKAIQRVPDEYIEPGCIITFHNVETNDWELRQFNYHSVSKFNMEEYWKEVNSTNQNTFIYKTKQDFLMSNSTIGIVHDGSTLFEMYCKLPCGNVKLITDFKESKLDLYSEDVEMDIVCPTYPKIQTQFNKPYRKGNSIYIINQNGEEEYLFDITDTIDTSSKEDKDKCKCEEDNKPKEEYITVTTDVYTNGELSNNGGSITLN